jgi:hypothetical protein
VTFEQRGDFADPANVLELSIDTYGNLFVGDQAAGADVQIVGLVGIDTQRELATLMDRVTLV